MNRCSQRYAMCSKSKVSLLSNDWCLAKIVEKRNFMMKFNTVLEIKTNSAQSKDIAPKYDMAYLTCYTAVAYAS